MTMKLVVEPDANGMACESWVPLTAEDRAQQEKDAADDQAVRAAAADRDAMRARAVELATRLETGDATADELREAVALNLRLAGVA